MKSMLKGLLERLPVWPWVFRIVSSLSRPKLIVLNYHYISGAVMAKHLDYLKRLFTFVTVDEFDRLFTGKKALKKNSILLTFDDGYRSFYAEVYPVLKKYNVPSLVFIPTGIVDTDDLIWTDYLSAAILDSDKSEIHLDGDTVVANDSAKRLSIYRVISKKMKQRDEKARQKIVQTLKELIDQDRAIEKYGLLSWEQVKEMNADNVAFGSHSHSHPILSTVDEAQLAREVTLSKSILEEKLGKRVDVFAYPNGKRSDYSDKVIAELKKAGYTYAFTTHQGIPGRNSDYFEIKRIMFFEKHSVPEIALKLISKYWR